MNVFGTMRRVMGKLPMMQDEEEDVDADEPNLSRRTILRASKVFSNPTSSTDDLERALEMIGHASYIGGQELNDIILPLIPNIISLIGDLKQPQSLRVQCLRSLDEICQFNKYAIDKVWKAVKMWQTLPRVIDDFESPLMSRWACKLTTTMIAHSMAFLKETNRIPNLLGSLQSAANFDHDWSGFGCNLAKKALTLVGRLDVSDFLVSELHRKSRQEFSFTSTN